jgi:hypothetical protein
MFGRAGETVPASFTLAWYLTPELWLALAAGALGSLPIGPTLAAWRRSLADAWQRAGADALGTVTLMLMLFASVMQMAARTYNPFIYFRF